MVIHPVSKPDLQNFAAAPAKVRRADGDGAPKVQQEPRTLNLDPAQTDIADEESAKNAVEWIRANILGNFPAVLSIQGNLDPLRVASLLEA